MNGPGLHGNGVRAVLCMLALASGAARAEGDDTPLPAQPEGSAASVPPTVPSPVQVIPSPKELEAQGAVIGKIVVVTDDVFDTSIHGEDSWLYRTANKLHINTQPRIIREQLLFQSGDRYDARLVDESERLLRRNGYLYDAKIHPIAWDGHTVDLEVRTKDVWTLNPGFNFSRSGGKNATGVHLQEQNLLGTGREVEVAWSSDVDSTAWTFSFMDPRFLAPHTRLAAFYSAADDGDSKGLVLERPFYALDTRQSWGTTLTDTRFVNPRYEYGKKVGEFRQHTQFYEARYGWSKGLVDGWVGRWTAGATWHEDQFELEPDKSPAGPLPPDQTWAYPWIGYEIVEDAWQERINQDQILRTEDVLVGLRGWARVGYASEAMGSTTDALMLMAGVENGADLSRNRSLFGSLTASGRVERGEIENGVFAAEARYYWETSSRSKFYALASGTMTHNLDEDQQLTLGGDTGLRGYPLRYQAGTAKALFTVEQRYYTDWYPFRLFRVGGAVFADAGRTWGRDVTGATSDGWLGDVGFGLRLGSSRSAFGNVIHIDLAFPLVQPTDIDSVQFVVETSQQF